VIKKQERGHQFGTAIKQEEQGHRLLELNSNNKDICCQEKQRFQPQRLNSKIRTSALPVKQKKQGHQLLQIGKENMSSAHAIRR
jgi:hypothetical protein